MTSTKSETLRKADAFVALHAGSSAFVIPNPWDPGSARLFEGLGFKALATTSSGFAQTLGRMDGQVSLAEKCAHCAALARVTSIPISADLENGFGREPEAVAKCIREAAAAGVVGGSIEDYSGDSAQPIYPENLAVERIGAAVEAARSCDHPFVLTARAEQLLRSSADLDVTIRRLQAYGRAGADVLYAPGLRSLDEIRAVSAELDKPLNVLGSALPNHTVAELAAAGAHRISIGGTLARVVLATTIRAATSLFESGDLSWTREAAAGADVRRFLGDSSH